MLPKAEKEALHEIMMGLACKFLSGSIEPISVLHLIVCSKYCGIFFVDGHFLTVDVEGQSSNLKCFVSLLE